MLVVDAENTEQQWARSARQIVQLTDRMGSRRAADTVMVQTGLRLDFTTEHDVSEVHRLIDAHKPDVIYLGPLYKLVPKEITTDDDAAPLLVALDGIRERGVGEYGAGWQRQQQDIRNAVAQEVAQLDLQDAAAMAEYDSLIAQLNREKERRILEAATSLEKFRPFLGS